MSNPSPTYESPPRPGTPGPKTMPDAQDSKVAYSAAVQSQRDKDWSVHPELTVEFRVEVASDGDGIKGGTRGEDLI